MPRHSDWTLNTLYVHLETRLNDHRAAGRLEIDHLRTMLDDRYAAQQEAMEKALLAAKEAVIKAETATERRFDAVNGFRTQLAEQAATLAPREYVETQIDSVNRRMADAAQARQTAIDEVRKMGNELLPREVFDTAVTAGRAERDHLREQVAALESRVDQQAGRTLGSTGRTADMRASTVALVAVATLLLSVAIFAANIITAR